MALLVTVPLACDGGDQSSTSSSSTSPVSTRAQDVTVTIGTATTFVGLRLTVVPPVRDPAPPGEARVLPNPGSRYVQVSVDVENPGQRGISFTPLMQAGLVDDAQKGHRPGAGLYATDISGVDMTPGRRVTGTISFVLPSDRTPDRLVFTDVLGATTTVGLG